MRKIRMSQKSSILLLRYAYLVQVDRRVAVRVVVPLWLLEQWHVLVDVRGDLLIVLDFIGARRRNHIIHL